MERWSEGGGSYNYMQRLESKEKKKEELQERVMFLTGLLHSSAPDHQSLLLVLLDLDEVGLPDLPLHQPAHSFVESEGAFDTVGAADHQSLLLLDLPDLLDVVDLLALLVPFQPDQSPAVVDGVVDTAAVVGSEHTTTPG